MPLTARQRLIEFLGQREITTAEEAARALKCTPSNARHHLSALIKEGVVQMLQNACKITQVARSIFTP